MDWTHLRAETSLSDLVLDLSLNRLKVIPNVSFNDKLLSLNVSGNMLTDISGLTSCSALQVRQWYVRHIVELTVLVLPTADIGCVG